MEARPWYKKVTQYFRRKKQVVPTITVHEFPLRDDTIRPAHEHTVRVKRRRRYRNPPIPQEQSSDPRFNHALRPKRKFDLAFMSNEGAVFAACVNGDHKKCPKPTICECRCHK
jgi:hypothetical protein